MAALDLTNMVHDGGGGVSEESKTKQKMTSLKLLPPTRPALETWSRLPTTHWPMLFSIYNVTLQGLFFQFYTMHFFIILNAYSIAALVLIFELISRNYVHM